MPLSNGVAYKSTPVPLNIGFAKGPNAAFKNLVICGSGFNTYGINCIIELIPTLYVIKKYT